MRVTLEIETTDPASFGDAYRVLNAFKGTGAVAAAPAAPNAPAAPAAPAATPPAAPAPATPPAPTAPPASAPPTPTAPAPAAAPPAPPPPPAAVGGITDAAFSAHINAFAKAYSPKACKARFAEVSAAFQLPTPWTKTSDIPAERREEVMPWFAVQA